MDKSLIYVSGARYTPMPSLPGGIIGHVYISGNLPPVSDFLRTIRPGLDALLEQHPDVLLGNEGNGLYAKITPNSESPKVPSVLLNDAERRRLAELIRDTNNITIMCRVPTFLQWWELREASVVLKSWITEELR